MLQILLCIMQHSRDEQQFFSQVSPYSNIISLPSPLVALSKQKKNSQFLLFAGLTCCSMNPKRLHNTEN